MVKLGLRTKFFLYSNTLIVGTMTLVTLLSVVHEREARYEAIVSRGVSIAEAMAIPITDILTDVQVRVVDEARLIENYITEMLSRNGDLLRYVVVTDADGTVIHSNRSQLLGRHFDRALGRGDIGRPESAEIDDSDGHRIIEVRTTLNVATRFLGSLAIGLSLEPIERQVTVVARRAVLVALVLLVFNSVLTALYVETLIRPILNLNQTMKWAGRGDLSVRAPERRGDEVGELSGAFNRMMDELEEARDREKVQRQQLAHTEKMVAVGTLAAGVAHEVNNPLSGILACLDGIEADPEDVDLRQRYLALIRDGLQRIERTVANLLDFSRQRGMRLEPTSINHNLRHVTELVGYQLRQAGIEARLELDDDEPLVMADHFQMEQLFLNLMLNAVQAMPGGGTLTLKTRVRDGRVVVEVRDTGSGIPPEIRPRIFDPFFTTREVGQGTGLGLAVSDSIVAAHGGTISVDSAVGAGTSFRIAFAAVPRERSRGEVG
jgi:two-component system, NtrC family, sensor kinase